MKIVKIDRGSIEIEIEDKILRILGGGNDAIT